MTRIIQISDPHIVPKGELAYGQVETSAPLKSCVETINRILPNIGPIDMVIVTGDLTDLVLLRSINASAILWSHLRFHTV